MRNKRCCVCGKKIKNWGNNPWPLTKASGKHFRSDSVCCDECDREFVIPARLLLVNIKDIQFVKKYLEVQENYERSKRRQRNLCKGS